MGKYNKGKKKLSNSLIHIVRKVFKENSDSTFNHKQICELINVKDPPLRKLAYSILEDLSKSGYLKKLNHNTYTLSKSDFYYEGVLQITARKSGFVIVENADIADIFIPNNALNQGIGGDLVKVEITKKGKKRLEGAVIEVIEREREQFVGTVRLSEKFAFLTPDNPRVGTDLYIPKEKLNGAKNGDKAIARITVWPKSAQSPYGEITEVLGNTKGNDAEMISILINQGLDYKFPEEVLSEAEKIYVRLDESEVANRRDFRGVPTLTIDPADAKDFDDAISFQRLDGGAIEVGVHIADVSHYVTPGSAMDVEALKRSNSVYLVDRVIPMLPEQLSNVVCSLRPHEDKFTFSAVFEMDDAGVISKQWFGKTVIHSDQRYSYEQAQEIIENKTVDGLIPFSSEILTLDAIAKVFREKRLKNGAMNIESEEVRFQLDEEGFPVDIIIKTSKDAHKLIEEFMLLANKKVAEFISKPGSNKPKVPFVYRCHDKPNPEKIDLFNVFIRKFGYDIDVTEPSQISKKINRLLSDIRYENEFSLIQSMAIRSMAKAIYDTDNVGHYGLAFKHYGHFTSPIRRYADLVVHRIVHEELTTKKHRYDDELGKICKRISRMERKAVEAERESTKYFQTLFIVDKIGEVFDGTISGVAEFGIFVRMDENRCEGMVPMNDIPGDHFHFDADRFVVIGSRTKKEYNFGDKVRVRVYEVSTLKRQINLELVVD